MECLLLSLLGRLPAFTIAEDSFEDEQLLGKVLIFLSSTRSMPTSMSGDLEGDRLLGGSFGGMSSCPSILTFGMSGDTLVPLASSIDSLEF